ncbi:MAG: glycosyltransferase [Candidatus Komeilibacteria bacterium]
MLKLWYIANYRLPSSRAHGIQTVAMCQALAQQGMAVTLVLPRRRFSQPEAIGSFYNLKPLFSIRNIPCVDLVGMIPVLGFWLQSLTFMIGVWFSLVRCPADTAIYSRDPFSAYILSFTGRRVIFEIHQFPRKLKWWHKLFFRRPIFFVAISQALVSELKQLGIAEKRVLLAPDGVDLELFPSQKTSEECRRLFRLPAEKKLLVYTGSLSREKGLAVMMESLSLLPADFLLVIAGGSTAEIKQWTDQLYQDQLAKVQWLGWLPHQQIPDVLQAADILIIPNSGRYRSSGRYTSPLKLYEYLSTAKPLVAADVESLRSIMAEQAGVFYFQPDQASSFVAAVGLATRDISHQYRRAASGYSWSNRAESIIRNFLNV